MPNRIFEYNGYIREMEEEMPPAVPTRVEREPSLGQILEEAIRSARPRDASSQEEISPAQMRRIQNENDRTIRNMEIDRDVNGRINNWRRDVNRFTDAYGTQHYDIQDEYNAVYEPGTRTFGIEIEGYGVSNEQLKNALAGRGISVIIASRSASHRNNWKITTDSTIEGSLPFELVSPVLTKDNFESIRIVFDVLRNLRVQVNTTCGLHVHVGVADMNVDIARNLVKRYAKYESNIDSFMDVTRRGSSNQYCRTLQNINMTDLDELVTIDEIIRATGQRYNKLNLHSYSRLQTVEFRQHASVINSDSVINWIKFCVGFVETTVNLSTTTESPFDANTKIGKFY